MLRPSCQSRKSSQKRELPGRLETLNNQAHRGADEPTPISYTMKSLARCESFATQTIPVAIFSGLRYNGQMNHEAEHQKISGDHRREGWEKVKANTHAGTGAGNGQGAGEQARKRPDLSKRNRERATHGHTRDFRPTKTYKVWSSMRERCHRTTHPDFPRYGGRGIKICERWNSFESFLADMGEKPDGKSLDRFPDGDGNYEPGNCRWATWKEQNNNTSKNVFVEFNGQKKTIAQWSESTGLTHSQICGRLRRGKTIQEALTP